MNADDETTPRHCAHCEYDLAGLPSPVCPECGQEQPEPERPRLVQPRNAWITLSVIGVVVFGVLTGLSVLWGTGLGATYTGDQELVEFTIAFAIVTGGYAVLGFELWWHSGRLPMVKTGDVWFMGVMIGVGGPFLAFLVLAIAAFLR